MEFIPLTLISPLYLLGVLTIDSVFDLANNKAYTITYYHAMRTAIYPANILLPLGIVLTSLPLLIRLLYRRKLLDLLTAFFSLGSIAIFVYLLIPLQEALGRNGNAKSEEAHKMIEIIQIYHFIIIGAMFLCIVLQLVSHKDARIVYFQDKNKNN